MSGINIWLWFVYLLHATWKYFINILNNFVHVTEFQGMGFLLSIDTQKDLEIAVFQALESGIQHTQCAICHVSQFTSSDLFVLAIPATFQNLHCLHYTTLSSRLLSVSSLTVLCSFTILPAWAQLLLLHKLCKCTDITSFLA